MRNVTINLSNSFFNFSIDDAEQRHGKRRTRTEAARLAEIFKATVSPVWTFGGVFKRAAAFCVQAIIFSMRQDRLFSHPSR